MIIISVLPDNYSEDEDLFASQQDEEKEKMIYKD